MLGHGYYLQTAHLESGISAVSFETKPTPQITEAGKDCNPVFFDPAKC